MKNQLVEFCYDSAGNLVLNTSCPQPPGTPFTPTYSYNAENQLTSTAGVTYTYDGDGKRVKKSNGKLYWYGMGSDPLTETDLSGALGAEFIFFNGKRTARLDLPSPAVHYYFSDHLGSASVVTSATGTIQDESDYYPFGGERVISSAAGNRYKFTGKERDSESNFGYFGARYNSSSIGRFTSPDPVFIQVLRVMDPQRLNLYPYARNNPSAFLDPTGKDIVSGTGDQKAVKAALVEIAKHSGGRDFLTKLDKLTVAVKLSTGTVSGTGDYGKVTGNFTTVTSKDTGKLSDVKGGPVEVTVDFKQAKTDREENKAGKEMGLEPKHENVPGSDPEQLGHEMAHFETRIDSGQDATEDQATQRIVDILAQPSDMSSKEAEKFVDELLKPKSNGGEDTPDKKNKQKKDSGGPPTGDKGQEKGPEKPQDDETRLLITPLPPTGHNHRD